MFNDMRKTISSTKHFSLWQCDVSRTLNSPEVPSSSDTHTEASLNRNGPCRPSEDYNNGTEYFKISPLILSAGNT